MNYWFITVTIILILCGSILRSDSYFYECKNEYFPKPRVFKVEKERDDFNIYTPFNGTYFPLCSSDDAISVENGIVCVYTGSNERMRLATLFPFEMDKITDYLLDTQLSSAAPSKWKQKSQSFCTLIK